MFAVFWRELPASTVGFPFILQGEGWDNHEFETLEAAQEYAKDWMEDDDLELYPDKPFDYSGQGHLIEIRIVRYAHESQ